MRKYHKPVQYVLFALVLLSWQILSSTGIIPENRLPSPLRIIVGLKELMTDGIPPGFTLSGHCLGSLRRVLGGVGIAAVTALPLGLCMGYWRGLRELLHPFVEFIRPVPPLAWVPIAILWFGIGDTSAVFIIFLGAFFPILLNTITGVISISKQLIESSILLGAGKRDIFFKVLLPGSLPSVITGVRIGLGIGWMTLVAAEFTGIKSGYGLGYMIMTARDLQRADQILAGMFVIGMIGYGMDLVVKKAEQKLLVWR